MPGSTLQTHGYTKVQWLVACEGPPWALFLVLDPSAVARYLSRYGQYMYDTMRSRGDFDERKESHADPTHKSPGQP